MAYYVEECINCGAGQGYPCSADCPKTDIRCEVVQEPSDYGIEEY